MFRYVQTLFIQTSQSTVANAPHVLEGTGMIRSARGWVTILDRDKLEEVSGDSYGRAATKYRRLNKPFAKAKAKL